MLLSSEVHQVYFTRGDEIREFQLCDLVWQILSSLKPKRAFPNHRSFPETGTLWWMRGEKVCVWQTWYSKKILCNEVIGQKVNCLQALLPEEFGSRLSWIKSYMQKSGHINWRGIKDCCTIEWSEDFHWNLCVPLSLMGRINAHGPCSRTR